MKVLTHSGRFHTDEVVSCMLIELIKGDIEITRSRNLSTVDEYDWVVDVGGKYDPLLNRLIQESLHY
jgi:uncharacterized UPF0160 family protein